MEPINWQDKVRIQLDPWQIKFLDTKGDKLLCTGRQVGKSVICGADAGEFSIQETLRRMKLKLKHHDRFNILMIAPTERQAYALFEKTFDYIILNNPKLIQKGRNRPTKTRIKLNCNVTIWCLPTGLNGIGIRFLTVHRLYEDECSRIPDAVHDAVGPMLLTTGGDTIYLSTPFGTQGEFYNALINQDNAYNSFTRFRTDSETVIRNRKICKTWTIIQQTKALQKIEQAKARMTALAFAQEYMGQPLNDLMQVFPDKLLENIMVLSRREHITPNRTYFLGQDIAGMGQDTSTWEILDGTNPKQVKQVENIIKKLTRTPERVEFTKSLERMYHFKKIGIDNGGLGSGDFDYLLKDNLTKRKIISLNNASKDLDQYGKKKKKLLKEDMYNNLLAMMEMGEILLLKDDNIYHSLRSIQFETIDQCTRYHGTDSHIAEGLIRCAWLAKTKSLNLFCA